MPRRRNDPAGVSDAPSLVTDPVREAELAAEFSRRVKYVMNRYRLAKLLGLDRRCFNEHLARLREKADREDGAAARRFRPSVWLELVIDMRARELAGLAPGERIGADHAGQLEQARMEVAERSRGLPGNAGHDLMRHYVEGLMALIQEATGRPVYAVRDRKSCYAPELDGKSAEAIRLIVAELEPDVSEITLSGWIRAIRSRNSGNPMRFCEYFPGYGASVRDRTDCPALAIS